ncbi:MAG: hypothetical protein ACOC0R_04115 [Mariniphaga sp.]
MKTITRLILLIAIVTFAACEGPVGPPGPPGEPGVPGEDGGILLPSVFEIEGDFLPENDFQLYYEFPNTIEVFESDVVLVYILWEVAESENGESIDVWRLLPQTVVLPDSTILQYNFDHTFADVQIFLDGNTNFDELLPEEALDQVFRIAVLPADFAAKNARNLEDYDLMLKSLGINPALVRPETRINLDSIQQ